MPNTNSISPNTSTPNPKPRRSSRLSAATTPSKIRPHDDSFISPEPLPKQGKSDCCDSLDHDNARKTVCCNCGQHFRIQSAAKKTARKYKFLDEATIKGITLPDNIRNLGGNPDIAGRSDIICNCCLAYFYKADKAGFLGRTVDLSSWSDDCLLCQIYTDKSSYAVIMAKKKDSINLNTLSISKKPQIMPFSSFSWSHRCDRCLIVFTRGSKHVCTSKSKIDNVFNLLSESERHTLAKKILTGSFKRSSNFTIYGVGRPMKMGNLSYRKHHLDYSVEDVISFRRKFKLSERACFAIMSHIRNHGRPQRVVFNIASKASVKAELVERVGDLFSVWDGVLNTGTDASPVYDPVSITYCNNITLLIQRCLKFRKKPDLPIAVKLGMDHGQGKLLTTLNLNFSNSVDELFVVAVSLECKENYSCLRFWL